jgi:hypothetical protein
VAVRAGAYPRPLRPLPMTSGDPTRRGPSSGFVLAAAMLLARRHRPVWSWRRWRRVCRCGADLPCRVWCRVPINRGRWPERPAQRTAVPERWWRRER